MKVQKTALQLKIQLRCSNPSLGALNLSLRAQISLDNRQMRYVREKKSCYVGILTIVGRYQILKRIPRGSNPKWNKKIQSLKMTWIDLKWFRMMLNDLKWCKMTKKHWVLPMDRQTDQWTERLWMQNFWKKKFKIEFRKNWFITGQWNFSCRYILRSSPGMQIFMIVWHIILPTYEILTRTVSELAAKHRKLLVDTFCFLLCPGQNCET